ncbi:inosine-uridine preferring nucleoside hydrolase-like isoform X2 [Leguminivora glycinivorella]|uniref:inosine-uridine preferring nucleoside hydrolase-like isoform X2 n=1 Tax=Leguminivora glycinivorella TaxID=1035111 RepID=UPI00200F1E74|nr:inosine-uridine preferring nucleoside hydrolase-like isoform X2 [Leguminivora glycinivorella]
MEVRKYKYWIILVAVLLAIFIPISTDNSEDNGPISKLIIDHDGGADDAMAIFMALLYEQYFNGPTLIALTTTHGNVNESQAFLNTQRVLDIAGRRDVPIYRGSKSSLVMSVPAGDWFGVDGLGDNVNEPIEPIEAHSKHAALGIIKLVNKHPGEITLAAIGSLTNVALAIQLEPELISRLSHLYVGAGHVYSESEPTPEFNAEQDAEAYHVIMQNATPDKVTILPFSQVGTKNITRQWREEVLGAIQTKIMTSLNQFERISLQYANYWSLLDPIVLGVLLNDTIVGDVKYSQNSIVLCGQERGINTNSFTTKEEANVKVINRIFQDDFKKLLLTIFSAELYN